MHELAKDVHEKHHVRKTDAQKQAFLRWATGALEGAGYETAVEEARSLFWKNRNLVVGEPEKADVIFTAHYDTPAVMPVPNIITPQNMLLYGLYQFAIMFVMFFAMFIVTFVTTLSFGGTVGFWAGELFFFAMFYLLLCGPANKNNANDNTSGVSTLLHAAMALPESVRPRVAFVFFDNEEKGMLGSAAFRKKHKQVAKETLLINFDCVGDGDEILLVLPKALRQDGEMKALLEEAFLPTGAKQVTVETKRTFYPSDQVGFNKGIAGAAFLRGKRVGLYLDKIHTGKDVNCDEQNIEILGDGIVRLAAALAGERAGACKENGEPQP